MAAILLQPSEQFNDSNGDPLSGGSITFYDTNTTTLKAVYSDAALTTSITNPAILDAAGRMPVDAYVTDGERYTLLVKDSTGAEIFTRNDVWGSIEDAASGAYTNTATGSVGRTLQGKLDDSVSSLDFATGDGITDDTTALQTWAQYCANNSVKGILAPGTYNVTNMSTTGDNEASFPALGKRLIIEGAGGKIKSTATGYTWTLEGLYRPTITGVEFIGTQAEDSGVYNVGNPQVCLYLNQCSAPVIERNHFRDGSGIFLWMDRFQEATEHLGAMVAHNHFYSLAYDATTVQQCCIYLGENGEYTHIHHNTFQSMTQAVRALGGANSQITHNNIMKTTITDTTLVDTMGMIFANGTGKTNSGKLIVAYNQINHNAAAVHGINIISDGTDPQNSVEILYNKILAHGDVNAGTAIRLRDYNGSRIVGNHIRTASTAAGSYALFLDACTDTIVDQNHFEEYGNGAIRLVSAATALIGRNVYESNATAVSVQAATESVKWTHRRSYGGRVSTAGAITTGCDADRVGWTVVRNGTGDYTVTHNIGAADRYFVQACLDNASEGFISVTRGVNSFDVDTKNTSAAAANANFMFMVDLQDNFLQEI